MLVRGKVPVSVVLAGRDFEDRGGQFTHVMGLDKGRGVLVRPDQHIVGAVMCNTELKGLLAEYFAS